MSETEREHWDLRYVTEGVRTTEPAAFLVEVEPRFEPESLILDVGGGSGRNAVWLARRGHRVTVADISEEGLKLARRAAAEADVGIDVSQNPPRIDMELIARDLDYGLLLRQAGVAETVDGRLDVTDGDLGDQLLGLDVFRRRDELKRRTVLLQPHQV